MQDYRKLVVWQRAHPFVLSVYAAVAAFPEDEKFGLSSQIKRAAASIPANIAEGCGRETRLELRRSQCIAMRSASESDYHLLLACDLNFLEKPVHEQLSKELDEVRRMLNSLIQSLSTKN